MSLLKKNVKIFLKKGGGGKMFPALKVIAPYMGRRPVALDLDHLPWTCLWPDTKSAYQRTCYTRYEPKVIKILNMCATRLIRFSSSQ